MSIFQRHSTRIFAKVQTALGSPATIAGSNAMRVLKDFTPILPKGEVVDRGLADDSRWGSSQAILGQWGEGGSYPIELRGNGTAGVAPMIGPGLLSVLGTETVMAADTVDALSGSVSGFDSSLDVPVGCLVRVAIGAGFEVRAIATKSGGGPYTYTVHRDFSQAPADDAEISAGVCYHHVGTEDPTYLTIEQYLDGQKHYCTDSSIGQLAINMSVKEILKATFGEIRSKACVASAASNPYTPVWDSSNPLAALNSNLVVNGVLTDMKSHELTVTTRRSREGINSNGISELPWLDMFDATGSLTPWVEDVAPITAFLSGTEASIESVNGETAGNIVAMVAQGVQYTGYDISDDEGDFAYNLPYKINSGFAIAFF